MRHNQTLIEKRVWDQIRNNALGVKFRRQVPVGPYFLDFACLELKLAVEIDGGEHAESKKDERRTKDLESLGFRVVRYWNNDVMANIEAIITDLCAVINERRAQI